MTAKIIILLGSQLKFNMYMYFRSIGSLIVEGKTLGAWAKKHKIPVTKMSVRSFAPGTKIKSNHNNKLYSWRDLYMNEFHYDFLPVWRKMFLIRYFMLLLDQGSFTWSMFSTSPGYVNVVTNMYSQTLIIQTLRDLGK